MQTKKERRKCKTKVEVGFVDENIHILQEKCGSQLILILGPLPSVLSLSTLKQVSLDTLR